MLQFKQTRMYVIYVHGVFLLVDIDYQKMLLKTWTLQAYDLLFITVGPIGTAHHIPAKSYALGMSLMPAG